MCCVQLTQPTYRIAVFFVVQEGFTAVDDMSAEADYGWEVDEEAVIKEMEAAARAAEERARSERE